jgi:hypothetical protein
MATRPKHFLIFAFFTSALALLGAAPAQTVGTTLKPNIQTVSDAAFGSGRHGVVSRPDGISPNAPSGSAETPPTAASAPFNYLMLRWRATTRDEELVHLEVRASADGATWTDWGGVHPNDDLVDAADAADVFWSSTIYTGLSAYWQLRVTLKTAPDGAAPVFHEVTVNTVDARGPSPSASRPAAPAGNSVSRPGFVSRADWGGSSVLNNSVAPTWYPANHLVVHHTADPNTLRSGESSWADRVRAEWSFHTYSRGWGDVGYNWLIAPDGVIYEGRNGSSDFDRDSVGFHDTGNKGSMGVAMLGTFGSGVPNVTPIVPTEAAQDAVVRMLAWKASQRDIDPLGSSFYYGCSISSYCAPYNAGSVVPNIAGHRQVTPGHTSCPGDLAANILDSIKLRVRDTIAGAPAPPPPPPPPNPTAVPQPTPVIGARDSRGPEISGIDANGLPLATAYRMGSDSQLQRAGDPTAIREGGVLGALAWDGQELDWGRGGPFNAADRFIINQVRPFLAPAAGTYTFETTSDDGSWLWIDGQLVVDNGGLHGRTSVSGSKWLAAGYHVMAIKAFDSSDNAYMRYTWLAPGAATWSAVPVPPSPGQVLIAADDLGGSGISKLQYAVDGSSTFQEQAGSIGIISLPEGNHSIAYRAQNVNGAWSANGSLQVRIDTTPPVTTLTATTLASGVIQLSWSSSPDAKLFEIGTYDATTGQWGNAMRLSQSSLSFFGEPGHTYQFTIRGWDGVNWESFVAPTPPQTVPATARFSRVRLPLISK